VFSLDEYIDTYVRPDDVRWTSQSLLEPRLTYAGETVVLTCLIHDVGAFFGQALDASFRSTSTWISTVDGWRCLAIHTSQAEWPCGPPSALAISSSPLRWGQTNTSMR